MDKERFWRAKETCNTRAMADFLVEEQETLIRLLRKSQRNVDSATPMYRTGKEK